MKSFDKLFEQQARHLAQRSSRRGMLKTLGGLLVGAGSIPLLPVARAAAAEAPARPMEEGDEANCDYWR
ncbi:MAG: methylamine dehydrogenase (amicyanin) light chain, partial [Halioglobus sp.]